MQAALVARNGLQFDFQSLEHIILSLGDAFDVRIVWNEETALLTVGFAVVGGLVSGVIGGRLAAAVGAGIGSLAGLGVSTIVSLREIWSAIKDSLTELYYIVYNNLRQLDAVDYIQAAELLLACYSSRRQLVITMLEFIAHKLSRQVLSSITVA